MWGVALLLRRNGTLGAFISFFWGWGQLGERAELKIFSRLSGLQSLFGLCHLGGGNKMELWKVLEIGEYQRVAKQPF